MDEKEKLRKVVSFIEFAKYIILFVIFANFLYAFSGHADSKLSLLITGLSMGFFSALAWIRFKIGFDDI